MGQLFTPFSRFHVVLHGHGIGWVTVHALDKQDALRSFMLRHLMYKNRSSVSLGCEMSICKSWEKVGLQVLMLAEVFLPS